MTGRPPADAVAACERVLREVLRTHMCPACKEGLGRAAVARVEDAMRRNGAPGVEPGTPPQQAVYLRRRTAMPKIYHEDASVYGRGVIHHPLTGRPEFKGIVDTADGPRARIEDGDLALWIDDVATLTRWAEQCRLAAEQLAAHLARLARAEQQREVQP